MMFNEGRLKDPGYYRENRLDPHTDHCWYLSDAERAAGDSALRRSLNGPWTCFHGTGDSRI